MTRLAARLAVGADRDDIVQDALARAWSKRHQYDGTRGSVSAWLMAITADQARKAARRLRPVAEVATTTRRRGRPVRVLGRTSMRGSMSTRRSRRYRRGSGWRWTVTTSLTCQLPI